MPSVAIPFNPNDENEYDSNNDKFNSQEEMLKCMQSERYKNDQGYRDIVAKLLANSEPHVLGVSPPHDAEHASVNDEIVNDYVRQTFGNPLYKTSAIYRRQVADTLASDAIDPLLKGRINYKGGNNNGGCIRVSLPFGDSTGPMPPERQSQEDQEER